MKYIIVFIFFLTGICESQAQVKFQKYVGMWATEFARSISICNDGTYLIGGYGFGAQFYHPYLVKMNTNGDTVWTRNYAGINGEELYACGQTFDGGYFIAGTTLANALYDYILIKTDSNGVPQWSKVYASPLNESCYTAIQTSDSGFVLAGYSQTSMQSVDINVTKVNSAGNIQWSKSLAGGENDIPYSIQQTTDGGYIITGFTQSFTLVSHEIFLAKLNSSGTLNWFKTYEDTTSVSGFSVVQTDDEGYIITGYNLNDDLFLLRTDSSGQVIWSNNYDSGIEEVGTQVIQTNDGGFAVAGFSQYNKSVLLVRSDSSGNVLWSKSFKHSANYANNFSRLMETQDHGFLLSSQAIPDTNWLIYDLIIIKTDSIGSNDCAEITTNTIASPVVLTVDTVSLPISPYIISASNYAVSAVDLTSDITICSVTSVPEFSNESDIQVFPNPAKNTISFNWSHAQVDELSIFSSLGNRVIHYPPGTFSKNTPVNISQLRSGFYCAFFTSKSGTNSFCVKFLKE